MLEPTQTLILCLGLAMGWKSIFWRQSEERRKISLLFFYIGFKIPSISFFLFEASLCRSVTRHTWSLVQKWYNENYYELFLSHVFLFQHASLQNVSGFDCLKQITVSIFKKWLKNETGGKRCKALRVCVREGERTSPVCGALHVVLCKEASICVCGMGWAWDSTQ